MKQINSGSKNIKRHLERYKTATMEELKEILGTNARMSIFRKLKKLSYKTSYSHNGKYYALEKTMTFNSDGLWRSKSICFSIHGTLMDSIVAFIDKSEAGYSVESLDTILFVSCREALLNLYKLKKVTREKSEGIYIHYSADPKTERKQVSVRQERQSGLHFKCGDINEDILFHELKAAIVLFFTLLDEKQKRLYSGLESLKIGHGGDKIISTLLGIDCHTVAKGRNEIVQHDGKIDRIREPGGGRKSIKKKS